MRSGAFAATWAESFTDVVLAGDERTRWLAAVLLYPTSFWRRAVDGRAAPDPH